ncbi:NAD(P)/FAD-dependent oxidoreductase [Streptomyces sp. NPDC059398]|uniref:NAD(P)/FAD-dependent oxidoreductase n=1 Tax=Streptomyces sp. NPDC059398 TaxID=3346820 RepID=UPI0036B7C1A1
MTDHRGRRSDVIVIGAGLAGLACAADLCREGLSVSLLEASDTAGGRMRTDRRDGFLLDRGFQVFNTSYPQVKQRMWLRGLRLRPFTPGALVHTPSGRLRFSDPTRRPGVAVDLLSLRPIAGRRDLLALGLLSARDLFGPASTVKRAADRTTRTALADAGISEQLVEVFFRPFLSGVFLEDSLETSSRFFHLVWRSMLRGTQCLPAAGIGAVPAQLAGALPPGVLRPGTPVRALTDTGVELPDGTELHAPRVVVATGPDMAARLLPGLAVPETRTVTTYYHAAPQPPLHEPTLLVDSAQRFLNTCVLSEVAPTYAPAERSLISTSVLGRGSPGEEARLRGALAEAYRADTSSWELLAPYTVEGALPAMTSPWPLSRTTRVTAGRYVCGDHRATGSVQGALASGARAAREVLEDRSDPHGAV